MAKPITKPMELAALKTRTRKSFSGITGSAATRSAWSQPTPNATPSTAVAMLGTDTHAHEIPPRLAKMMSDVAEPARRRDPA